MTEQKILSKKHNSLKEVHLINQSESLIDKLQILVEKANRDNIKNISLIILIILAYEKILKKGFRHHIDLHLRLLWLENFVDKKFLRKLKTSKSDSLKQKYCCNMRPLFDSSLTQVSKLKTRNVIKFILTRKKINGMF